jgi:chromate reductase
MITVISGSNRQDSECLQFARKFHEMLTEKSEEEVKLLALEKIPHDWFFPEMYQKEEQADSLKKIQDEYMIPASKFLIVTPEYNGSYPGVLKLFLDACSVRAYSETFKWKKAALAGVASGRAGNLLGLDHLAAVLNHLGVVTLPSRLPISQINRFMEGEKIADKGILSVMEQHVEQLLNF